MTSPFRRHAAAILILAAALPVSLHAYSLEGPSWASGNISMQLQLGAPGRTLSDGATQWDEVAAGALENWNNVLGRSRFVASKGSTAPKARGNAHSNVFFDSTAYGDAFGSRVLAVTLMRSIGSRFVEADVIVNTAISWDSYRGSIRSSTDLQRVVLHEFGHVLGLDHPDQATPPQQVAAIMNSRVGNVNSPQSDDIAGVESLYGSAIKSPASPGTLASQSILAGTPLRIELANTDPTNTRYTWRFTRPGGTPVVLRDGDGNPVSGPSFALFSAQPADTGTYAVAAVSGTTTSAFVSASVTVTPVNTADGLLANLSTRGRADTGSATLIGGFVVGGRTPKPVLIRAAGPTLSTQNIAGPAADPALTVFRMDRGTATVVAQNDNWSADPAAASALRSAAQRLGAFPFPSGSRDAALLVTLAPGAYTAQISASSGAGVALFEVYDADTTHSTSLERQLLNLSSRGYAGSGEDQMIAGFVVTGNAPKQVLVRAVGPGLSSQGVGNVLSNPRLVLFRERTQIAVNDDWGTSNQADILPAVFSQLGAFALTRGSKDSALLITLPPGIYTAMVNGQSGETGVVLVEVYEVSD